MPTLKPSALATVVAIAATAVAGIGGLALAHPDIAEGALIVGTAANAVAPYLSSIGD